MPKYFREVNKHFSGDKTLAARYMGVARSLLGGLVEMSGDLFQNARKVILPDGTKITVSFAGALAKIAIDVSNILVDKAQDLCRIFRSGLLSVETVGHYDKSGVEVDADSPDKDYEALKWLYQSPHDPFIKVTPETKVSVKEFAGDRFIPTEFSSNFVPATYYEVFSAAYSGAMRQAIQLLLGMGEELVTARFFGVTSYVYDFKYEGTCGLVRTKEYTEEQPSFWLVRISQGIVAIPFPVCTSVTKKQKDAGVTWVPIGVVTFPQDIAAAIADGSAIEVMSGDEFSTAVAGFNPMYPDCGWAFSLSGHECKNVLYTSKMTDTMSSEAVPYTQVFTITFDTTESISATIAKDGVEQSFIGPPQSVPRFPYKLPGLTSLLPFGSAFNTYHPYWDKNTDCPVHVFYRGDEAQVVSYVNKLPADAVRSGDYWNAIEAGENLAPGFYTGKRLNAGATETYYEINSTTINTYTASGGGEDYSLTIVEQGYVGPQYIGVGGEDPFTLIVFEPSQRLIEVGRKTRPIANNQNFALMCVPFNQREGVYVLDAERVISGAFTPEPDLYKTTRTKSDHWRLRQSSPPTPCPSGYYEIVIDFTKEDTVYFPGAYLDLPGVYVVTQPILAGGIGLSALTGCFDNIFVYGGLPVPDVSVTYPTVPAEDTAYGEWKFYSSGDCVVTTELTAYGVGSVIDKINTIVSTDYVQNGSSMVMYGSTDGINPNKYIVFREINTVDGAFALTNTTYPVSEMKYRAKSFVGIAN